MKRRRRFEFGAEGEPRPGKEGNIPIILFERFRLQPEEMKGGKVTKGLELAIYDWIIRRRWEI